MTGDKEWMKFHEYFQIYNFKLLSSKEDHPCWPLYALGAARVRVLCLKNGNIYIYT